MNRLQNSIFKHFNVIFLSFPCHFTDCLPKSYPESAQNSNLNSISDIFLPFPCHFADWFPKNYRKIGQIFHSNRDNSTFLDIWLPPPLEFLFCFNRQTRTIKSPSSLSLNSVADKSVCHKQKHVFLRPIPICSTDVQPFFRKKNVKNVKEIYDRPMKVTQIRGGCYFHSSLPPQDIW